MVKNSGLWSLFTTLVYLGFASCQTLTNTSPNDLIVPKTVIEATTNTANENGLTATDAMTTKLVSQSTSVNVAETQSDVVTVKAQPTFQLPEDTYEVHDNGKICILVKLDAKFSFDYKEIKQKAEDTTDITFPDYVNSTGDCGNGSKLPEISLLWHSFKLKFTFAKTTSGKNWFVKVIQFSLTSSNGSKDGKAFNATSKESELNIKAPLNMSYACSTPAKIKLYDDAETLIAYAVLENIRIQAYAYSDGAFDTEYPCSVKQQTETEIIYPSDTVPIAVGSTLAVVTMLIAVGYGIYRSLFMKKVDYDTMED